MIVDAGRKERGTKNLVGGGEKPLLNKLFETEAIKNCNAAEADFPHLM